MMGFYNNYKLGGGAITITGLATGFRGMKIFSISIPYIILSIGCVIGFVFLGWFFHSTKEINKNVSIDSKKEAKRIFDKLI